MKVILVYNSNGWGYETLGGFFGYFKTRAEALADLNQTLIVADIGFSKTEESSHEAVLP